MEINLRSGIEKKTEHNQRRAILQNISNVTLCSTISSSVKRYYMSLTDIKKSIPQILKLKKSTLRLVLGLKKVVLDTST